MKVFRKCLAAFLTVVFIFLLSACGGEENTVDNEKYEAVIKENLSIDYLSLYSKLPSDQNRVGISVSGGEELNEEKCILISFRNSQIYQSLSDCTQLISRCHLFDAEHPENQIETKFFTVANGTSEKASFEGALSYGKGAECEYVLVKFDGVLASENPNWETPAIFWIIALEENGTVTVLTQTPLLDH